MWIVIDQLDLARLTLLRSVSVLRAPKGKEGGPYDERTITSLREESGLWTHNNAMYVPLDMSTHDSQIRVFAVLTSPI